MPVIADNCAVNKTVAREMGCQFICYASHLFNLAVKDIIAEHCHLIDDIKAIMIKLRFSVHGAKLRKWTDLASFKCSETRWSSVEAVLEGYIEI